MTQITVLPSSIFPSRVCHDHTVVVLFASGSDDDLRLWRTTDSLLEL